MAFGGPNPFDSRLQPAGESNLRRLNLASAVQLYETASLRAKLHKALARITGKSLNLIRLNDCMASHSVLSSHYGGITTVPLSRIIGSEGRSDDFNAHFEPLQQHTRQRWINIALALFSGDALPPVQLIQSGDVYYVRDGHHRVSVARSLGQRDIEAEIYYMDATAADTESARKAA